MPDPNQPIGSQPANSPCDPCYDPGQNCQATTAELAVRLCAVEAQWQEALRLNAKLRKSQSQLSSEMSQVLEEMNRLRELINELSGGGDSLGCSNMESVEVADGIEVCDAGTKKLIRPKTDPTSIVLCGGRVRQVAKGLAFYPLDPAPTVFSANMSGGTYGISLSDFPDPPCGGQVYAVFASRGTTATGPSGSATSFYAHVNNLVVCQVGLGNSTENGMVFAPVNSASEVLTVVKTGSGTTNLIVQLLGYMY